MAVAVRRWIGRLAALASLIAWAPSQTVAQGAQDAAVPQAKIALLLLTGRNLDAVERAKGLLESAPSSERQSAYRYAAQICMDALDSQCARDLADHPVLKTFASDGMQPTTAAYGLLLWAYAEIAAGNYQATADWLGPKFPIKAANALNTPELFAEFQLLAARRSRLVFDFGASRDHLDKALISILSLKNERFDAPRLLVRLIGQLLENYDVERALRLAAAADPLFRTIPPDSFLAFEYQRLRAALSGYSGDFAGAARELHAALSKLDRLQLQPTYKASLQIDTFNNLLGLELLHGNRDAARDLLGSHPLMATKSAIQQRGYFENVNEFNFALGEEFVRFVLADPTKTGWGALMTMPPRWTQDPERIAEMAAFGQAALGLELLKAGKEDEARQELVGAAKKRLSTLRDLYRKSAYAAPLPRWPDLILTELALTITLLGPAPDYDLVVQGHTLLTRSIATNADDALTTLAVQPSDERKRFAQSLRTIQYQQVDWEKEKMAALIKRLLSPDRIDTETLVRERQGVIYGGNNFVEQQQRLRAALSDGSGAGGVEQATSLATLKQLLLADEALVLHVSILDHIGKICVRSDQTISSTQQVDPVATTDARILRAALTAAHPASIEADSQFPVIEAVRTGKLLFGGLEDCLRRSRRIYLVSSGQLAGVPPAALLTEVPPAMGAGFDLRAAHWMIRDHSFVRISSLGAFVATKQLSRTKRATLDYLGVGDPVLAPRTAAALSGGALAARGSLPVQSGALTSLPELPETSDELQRAAELFGKPKTRVLRREAANEEEFRLQPLSEFDILHFATHGLVKEEQPGLREPSLVLTPKPDGDDLNDGLLTSSQIATLPLRARLVVLSACNSARYEPSIIDSGIQGLSTSFAIAGVPSMIASLWPIESSLTRDLIIATFKAARGGNVAIADALAIAVRQHLDGPAPRPLMHPRFWAALVVLGDGSVSLDASTVGVPRDLGPFSAVTPTEHGEILHAMPLDDGYVTAAFNAPDGKTFAGLLQRQAADGTTKWEVKSRDIGVGPVIAAKQIVYAGGYVLVQNGAATVTEPVMRALQPDGKVLWTRRLEGFPEGTTITGLAFAQDQSAIAVVGPTRQQRAETAVSLLHLDIDGQEVARTRISLPGYGQSPYSALLNINAAVGLIAVNRDDQPVSGDQAYKLNGLGNAVQCWGGSGAEIALVDVPALKESARLRIDRFRARSATAMTGGWVLVGDIGDDCSLQRHAVAYAVGSDGSVHGLWRDTSPFSTSARGARKVGQGIEIVGSTERSIAVLEEAPPAPTPTGGRIQSSPEAYVSGEIFSVRLSEGGDEERKDFVGAGFPIAVLGMASTDDRSAIFGTIGSRPLWLER